MAPFKALYGRRCPSPISWSDHGDTRFNGTNLVQDALDKVLSMKGIIRVGKKGKLSMRFTSPFEVLKRAGEVSYEINLPPSLSGVHPIFHVSMLQRYHVDRSHVLDYSSVQLDESLGYEEEPVAIIDKQVHKLSSKKILAVKAQ
ncbi:uncharacterized protein [Nicotiana sylvestris]|uniref:uncharacterized protein n=1 Tax=Nicotiana sylvestris TaxID=4096 RepID=UPI00388CA845